MIRHGSMRNLIVAMQLHRETWTKKSTKLVPSLKSTRPRATKKVWWKWAALCDNVRMRPFGLCPPRGSRRRCPNSRNRDSISGRRERSRQRNMKPRQSLLGSPRDSRRTAHRNEEIVISMTNTSGWSAQSDRGRTWVGGHSGPGCIASGKTTSKPKIQFAKEVKGVKPLRPLRRASKQAGHLVGEQ